MKVAILSSLAPAGDTGAVMVNVNAAAKTAADANNVALVEDMIYLPIKRCL
jgi:hypothetical protein